MVVIKINQLHNVTRSPIQQILCSVSPFSPMFSRMCNGRGIPLKSHLVKHTCIIIPGLFKPWLFTYSLPDRCFNYSGSPTSYLPAIHPACPSAFRPACSAACLSIHLLHLPTQPCTVIHHRLSTSSFFPTVFVLRTIKLI